MKFGLMTAACLSLTIVAAQAQTAPATDPAKPAATTPQPRERLVCHEDYETGSIVHKKKRCMTAAQWRQVTAENANEFERHTAMKSAQSFK